MRGRRRRARALALGVKTILISDPPPEPLCVSVATLHANYTGWRQNDANVRAYRIRFHSWAVGVTNAGFSGPDGLVFYHGQEPTLPSQVQSAQSCSDKLT